jgi:hypothetical protein
MEAQIDRNQLPRLPDPAVNLIQTGLFSLFRIQQVLLLDGRKADYILRTGRRDFLYLNSLGEPLPIRPSNIGEHQIIEMIRFNNAEDRSGSLLANIIAKF